MIIHILCCLIMVDVCWFVLFAAHKKAGKIRPFLDEMCIEYFYPMSYQERQNSHTGENKQVLYPILGNFIFVKSSKRTLDTLLKTVKLHLNLSSDLYYRDRGSRKIIIVPNEQMDNFIQVASQKNEPILYLSNEEINLKQGDKVKIIDGVFKGVEGIFMRIKGSKRVVVAIPELFAVATAYLPTRFIQAIE